MSLLANLGTYWVVVWEDLWWYSGLPPLFCSCHGSALPWDTNLTCRGLDAQLYLIRPNQLLRPTLQQYPIAIQVFKRNSSNTAHCGLKYSWITTSLRNRQTWPGLDTTLSDSDVGTSFRDSQPNATIPQFLQCRKIWTQLQCVVKWM